MGMIEGAGPAHLKVWIFGKWTQFICKECGGIKTADEVGDQLTEIAEEFKEKHAECPALSDTDKELKLLHEIREHLEAEIDQYDRDKKADECYLDLKREHHVLCEKIDDIQMELD